MHRMHNYRELTKNRYLKIIQIGVPLGRHGVESLKGGGAFATVCDIDFVSFPYKKVNKFACSLPTFFYF